MLYILGLVLFIIFLLSQLNRKIFSHYINQPALAYEVENSGSDMAAHVLQKECLSSVSIHRSPVQFSNAYVPDDEIIWLSGDIFSGKNFYSLVIAAHEASHAVQHKTKYLPLFIQLKWFPFIKLLIMIEFILLVFSLFFHFFFFVASAIILYGIFIIYHMLTIWIEINANKRALMYLSFFLPRFDRKKAVKLMAFSLMDYIFMTPFVLFIL